MPLWWPLVLAGLLFSIGVYGVLVRRNAVLVLMGVELMLNAVNINLVAFDADLRDALHGGQTLALFVVVVAAAEIGLALAIVLRVFRTHGHIEVAALRELADRDELPGQDGQDGQPGLPGRSQQPEQPEQREQPGRPQQPEAQEAR